MSYLSYILKEKIEASQWREVKSESKVSNVIELSWGAHVSQKGRKLELGGKEK